MSGPVLQMLGTRYVDFLPSYKPISAQCRSNRYNVEPFFFSSSINWIPSRYQVSISRSRFCGYVFNTTRMQENALPKIGDRVYINSSIKDTFTLNKPVDITVTLTFIRTMDQTTSINPSNQSTLVEQPTALRSRLESKLSVFSWWTYFANQIEEIGNIDTLAPVVLHSSTTAG